MKTEKERQLDDGRGEGSGWGRAKSYDGKKIWSSTNYVILSAIR
jgi:hypothetical protein